MAVYLLVRVIDATSNCTIVVDTTGQSWDRAGGTGLVGQGWWDRVGGTGLVGQGWWDRAGQLAKNVVDIMHKRYVRITL